MKAACYLIQFVALLMLGWASIVAMGTVGDGLFWASVIAFAPALFLTFWVYATHGFKRAPQAVSWASAKVRPWSAVLSVLAIASLALLSLLNHGWARTWMLLYASVEVALTIVYVGLFADYGRD